MASDSLEPLLGLMEMPDEVLLEICANLCPHCSNIPMDLDTDLTSLSMTGSKRLRDIAQSVLRHYASPKNIRRFLQTITEQPDLAAQVRRFHNSDGDCFSLEAEAHNDVDSSNYEFDLTNEMLDGLASVHYRLLETTLAKLTGVKHLDINLPSHDGDHLYGSLEVSVPMKSVTRLSLIPWSGIDLGQMSKFLAMIPCLETLEVRDCTNITQQLPLASLRSLTFENSEMEEMSLQNIVESCPKLEHFNFGFTWKVGFSRLEHGLEEEVFSYTRLKNGSEPVTWSQAQRILHSRRETLKHLRLQFSQPRFPQTMDQEEYLPRRLRQEEYFSSFREFNALESLWVLTISFGSKDDRGTIPTFPKNVQHLVSMLPESLTCICFCGSHKEWDGLRVLARALQEGHFPRLKSVMLEKGYADPSGRYPEFIGLEEYQELFTTLGVFFELLQGSGVDSKWKQYTTTEYA